MDHKYYIAIRYVGAVGSLVSDILEYSQFLNESKIDEEEEVKSNKPDIN